jgi:AcrR family transcriptional regulator
MPPDPLDRGSVQNRNALTRYQIPETVSSARFGLVYSGGIPAAPQLPVPTPSPPTLRDRTALAVRDEISAVAMELFFRQGYDDTTVDQIVAAAGISRTSFFRYFAAKEDIVLGRVDELGHQVLEALRARPAEEPVWQALRRAFEPLLELTAASPERWLAVARMLNDSPSLKAGQLGRQLSWQDLLVPEIAQRLGIASDTLDPRPRALAAAAIACLNAARDTWTAPSATLDLPTLLDQAMNALTDHRVDSRTQPR